MFTKSQAERLRDAGVKQGESDYGWYSPDGSNDFVRHQHVADVYAASGYVRILDDPNIEAVIEWIAGKDIIRVEITVTMADCTVSLIVPSEQHAFDVSEISVTAPDLAEALVCMAEKVGEK